MTSNTITQHNTTQYKTTQHNTTQHNTTQHNTIQHKLTQLDPMLFARSEMYKVEIFTSVWSLIVY